MAFKEMSEIVKLWYFSMVQTQVPLGQGHFGPGGHHLNKLDKRFFSKCYISNIKHLSPAVLEMKILKYILFSNTRPARAILDPRVTFLTNLVEVNQVLLHTKFRASEHTCSEEEDFFYIYILCISMVQNPYPWGTDHYASLDLHLI